MESYRSPFSHGLSANVLPPQEELKKILEEWLKELTRTRPSIRTRTRESVSDESTTSNVSSKRDQSKDINIDLKRNHSPIRVPLKLKASTGSNCSSIKTDRSQGFIDAKKICSWVMSLFSSSEEDAAADDSESDLMEEEWLKKQTRTSIRTSGSCESITSSVSKEDIINFRERRFPLRPDWPGVSFPMKSYWSFLQSFL